jgi:hypothetical protein
MENLRDQGGDMINQVADNLIGIKGYLDTHERLLDKENTLIRDIGIGEDKEKQILKVKM